MWPRTRTCIQSFERKPSRWQTHLSLLVTAICPDAFPRLAILTGAWCQVAVRRGSCHVLRSAGATGSCARLSGTERRSAPRGLPPSVASVRPLLELLIRLSVTCVKLHSFDTVTNSSLFLFAQKWNLEKLVTKLHCACNIAQCGVNIKMFFCFFFCCGVQFIKSTRLCNKGV